MGPPSSNPDAELFKYRIPVRCPNIASGPSSRNRPARTTARDDPFGDAEKKPVLDGARLFPCVPLTYERAPCAQITCEEAKK